MTQDLATPPALWRRSAGVELLGPVSGSGIRHATFLVKRTDGQVVQLTELLHLIVEEAAGALPPDQLARRVSERFGRELDAESLTTLAEAKLEPLGLLEQPGRHNGGPAPTARPLFSLSAKGTLLSRRLVSRLSFLLQPLFAPPVIVIACAALVALDIRLWLEGGLASAFRDILLAPPMLLGMFALMVAGSLFHEIGHATACRYGGATPGVIGVGIYLVIPAFYTDVTDSYRLGRAGRLRTDLGGIYFHLLWTLAAGALHLATGSPLMLMVAVLTQLQMAQQLPPTIRLDGYFVLADLAGVPDLFSRVGPVLRSLAPGRPTDPRVAELRPRSRWIVTGWVLMVVPLLAVLLLWLFISLPFVIVQTFLAIAAHAQKLALSAALGQPVEVVLALLSIVLLAVPVIGALLVAGRLVGPLLRKLPLLAEKLSGPRPQFPADSAHPALPPRHARPRARRRAPRHSLP